MAFSSQDSSVGKATGYGMNDTGSIPGRARLFSFTQRHAHPASCPKHRGLFRKDKAAGMRR
jgi:hypothetical protein